MFNKNYDETCVEVDFAPPPFTVPEFLDWAKIGRTLFYKLVKDGKGPKITKIGDRTLVRREEAVRWLAALEV
jgi:predicted DNA-binding transcriptional regulator AlpA